VSRFKVVRAGQSIKSVALPGQSSMGKTDFASRASTAMCEGAQAGGFIVPGEPVFRYQERMKDELDAIDWKILQVLQEEGRITNVALAERVGISAPPCLRRMRALEDAGIIRGYRAMLDPALLGQPVTAFAMVGLHSQSEADLNKFQSLVDGWPLVREAFMMQGEVDFCLRCVAPDVMALQDFVMDELTKAENVESVRTLLTIRQTKDAGAVPIAESLLQPRR
jgi:DNA-binding Lrp family transcriptional regulator